MKATDMWPTRLAAICLLMATIVANQPPTVQALTCYACSAQELPACGSLKLNGNLTVLPSVTCETGVVACSTRLSTQGFVERGCEPLPEQCTDSTTCAPCTGDQCNGDAFPVNSLQCLQCAGAECESPQAAHPCPLYVAGDRCYTAFSKDGRTVFRGCVAADLNTVGGRHCTELGPLCVRCSRNGCNTPTAITQDNPLSCIKCDSLTDPDCASLSVAADHPAEQCDEIVNGQTDRCYVHTRDDHVERGCLSERFALESDCNRTLGDRCALCNGDGCNSGELKAEQCIECDSEVDADCAKVSDAEAMQRECPLSATPVGCYRYEEVGGEGQSSGDIIKRGCVSGLYDDEALQCAANRMGCKTCTGDDCNAKPHFQSCHTCSSADDLQCYVNATGVPTVECGDYLDQCYVHVADNTVKRGCLSLGDAQVRDDCATNPLKCEVCDEKRGCNAKAVGADDNCYTCDSRVDPNCRNAVDDSMKEQCSFSVRSLGCFHAEDEDGHVRRGCLNSVQNTTEVALCLGQSDTCKTCTGAFCNEKPQFQSCHVCNSTENVACIRSPGAFRAQLCTDYLDECYVHVVDNVVTRGCLANAVTEVRTECDAESAEFCETCSSTASCNNKLVDGEFCYECDSTTGDNCGSGQNFTMRKQCPLAVGQRGCYLFDDGETVKRGCVADVTRDEQLFCRREGETCKTCVGDDCNSKQTFQQCRVCRSTETVNCVRSPHVTPAVTCRHYDDECFVHVKNSTVTRGCLQQHGNADAVKDCGEIATDVCETCSATGTCNQKIVDGEFCIRCDSENDPNCAESPDHTLRDQCPLSPIRRGCYRLQEDDGRVQRGCLADLEDAEIEECREDGARCKSCLGDDCNAKPEFQRCRTCNSTANAACIRSPNAFTPVVCRRYLDECYTHVVNNVVLRGCLAQGPLIEKVDCYNNNTDLCEKCSSGPSCNNRIVDGEFCLTCDSKTDPDCATGQNFTMRTQCPLSPTPRGCYLFDDGGGDVKRGCVADLVDDEIQMCRRQGSTCKTCIGNDCNQKTAFQTCRACNSTASVNCIRAPQAFAAVQCREYDDKCITHVQNNTVTRGCLNSQPDATIRADCTAENDFCETCENGTCNTKIVDGEFCLTCDSATDPNCVSNLNHTMRTQCPLSPSPRGCYLFNDGGGDVKRGCVADLVEDEVQMCRREGNTCKTCIGNDCNAKVAFQQCRVCSSANSVNCIRSPGSFAAQTCRNYTDECFVHVVDNVVTRGCLSEASTPTEVRAECAAGDGDMCDTCSDRLNCNNRVVDGEFCITCDAAADPNCSTGGNFTMREQCPLSVQPRGCYLFADGGGDVKRGCVGALLEDERQMCRGQGSTCKTCHGNDCNAQANFQRCRTCNSTSSVNCIRSPGSFLSQLCHNYLDECYTHVVGNVVTRGCLSDSLAEEVRSECESDSDEFCATCSGGTICNNKVVDGEFCYECDSTTGDNCGSGQNFTMRKQCPLAVGRRGCYLFDDGETVKRGCVADVTRDEQLFCRREGDTCKTCVGDDCNSKQTFQQCRTCRSTEMVNCVRAPHVTPAVTCRHYDDECFVHVKNSTVTRGCLQQHGNAEMVQDCGEIATDVCETCAATGTCNQKIVDGEFCIRCDSDNDPKCADSPDHTLRVQCPLSPIRRGCYRLQEDDGRVQRGCLADLEQAEIDECQEDGARCKSCLGDDCNAKPEFQRCRTCNSTANAACIRSPNAFASVVCRRYQDECYTHVVNNVVLRGCLAQGPLIEKVDCYNNNSDLCEKCSSGPSCNNRIVDGEFCLTCDSKTDPDCATGQNFTMRTQCPLSPNPRGCYLFDDGGGDVKRGCVADLVDDEIQMCRRQGGTCKTCIGNDCNQKTAFQTCRACNSTASVNCIRAPQAFAAVQCRDYDDQCITHVQGNIVTRGCLNAQINATIRADCTADNDFCETCENGTCNTKIVDGEFCLTCDSKTDPNCASGQNFTMRTQCPLSPSPRGCYLFNDGGGDVKRGCVADLVEDEVQMCRRQGSTCKTCIGNDCNQKTAFQTCRTCNSTASVNCIRAPQAFATVQCREYDDKCITHVQGNIVTRGCLGSQPNATIRADCTADNDFCETCENGACNTKIVDGEFCLTCDSATDPNCVSNVNHTMRTQCPLSPSPRGCYLFNDGGGDVKRGCVADLVEDEVQMCRRQGDTCKTCLGNDCNAKVTFEYCRTCSSANSVSCIRSPGAFASRLCRNYTDVCYTHVVGDVVTRGCLAEASVPVVQQQCAATEGNNEFCEKCSTGQRGCNNRIVDGEFCLTCDSGTDENCVGNANFTMRTQCPLAVAPRGCYRFDDGGGIVKRGCVADLVADEIQMCRRQGQTCKTCIGNDCNELAGFQQCKQCTSQTDVDCFRGPGWVESVTCRNYHDQCFFHAHNNTMSRGCLSNTVDPLVKDDCAAGRGEFCALCTGPNCNNRVVDGEFCLECDSGNDTDCALRPDWTMRKQCDLSIERRGCYRFDDGGGIVKRGCVSDIHEDEVAMCRRQGQFCKTCVGDDCNAKVAFQTCRVCNSTQSVNCIRSPGSFASQVCRNYTDVCYAHVRDNEVTRGCLTAAPVAVQETCETNPELCEKCTGASCNNRVVDGEFCLVCDSRIDPNCARNVNHTMREQCPLSVNPRGCFREEVGDAVLRGCVANRTLEELDQCAANPDKCKVCVGNDCNAKLDFQYCRVCDSKETVNCVRNAIGTWVEKQQCERYTDECFVHVKDNRVTRGCLAQQEAQLQEECNDEDVCAKCSGGEVAKYACNSDIVDGEFCLTCDSHEDNNCRLQTNIGMRKQCNLAVKPLGCFHFADAPYNVQRGCISDLNATAKAACAADDAHCKVCLGNDCNRRPEFPRCLTCDTETDPQCAAANINTTLTLDCADYADECYTHLDGFRVRRGCVREAEGMRQLCEAAGNATCRICPNGQCNQVNVEPERCLECDSQTQPGVDCMSNLAAHSKSCSTSTALSFDRQGCFHQILVPEGGGPKQVSRGCVAHLEQAQRQLCSAQGVCKTCEDDDCNDRAEFQRCFKCGLFDTGNCADITSPEMKASDCNLYENSCATYILPEGNTVRGCARDLRSLGEVDRIDCVGNDCNGVVYPEERLRCHQCSGADCSDVQAPAQATVCRHLSAGDRCYGFVDANNHMNRGCESDKDAQRQLCDEAGQDCARCTGSGCNSAASYRDPTLSCVQCGDETCEWAQLAGEAMACRKPVAYGHNETCYTYRTTTGASRGCTNDLGAAEVCPEGSQCSYCEGAACNTQNTVMQVCQVCNTSLSGQGLCREAGLVGYASECPSALYTERGCFTRNDGGVISRGCSVSLSFEQRTECASEAHKNTCVLCLSPDCNTRAPPSSALALQAVSMLTLLAAVAVAVRGQMVY